MNARSVPKVEIILFCADLPLAEKSVCSWIFVNLDVVAVADWSKSRAHGRHFRVMGPNSDKCALNLLRLKVLTLGLGVGSYYSPLSTGGQRCPIAVPSPNATEDFRRKDDTLNLSWLNHPVGVIEKSVVEVPVQVSSLSLPQS
ncbi:hypothetical protein TNCV_1870661 [Trichonephila clavipes]|nr:hypothetical protein TNCV_1870661 [Trichonephila clavipes]